MNNSTIAAIVVVVVLALGGWYWYAHSGNEGMAGEEQSEGAMMQGSEQATTTPAAPAAGGYVAGNLLLGTDASATLGKYLIGSNGMTLYTYAPDTTTASNCTGQCAVNWPPYTITDTSVLANLQAGVSGQAGTITRADGSMQVTYNGHPLYFYAKDMQSGDTTGQGVGGVWYVVTP